MGWRDKINTDIATVWRQASTWVIAFLAPFPDIYNTAASWVGYADIPSQAKHALYAISFVGLLAKHYRQAPPKASP